MYLKTHILIVSFLALVFQGCSLAPDYLRPQMPVAESFPGSKDRAARGDQYFTQPDWSDYFPDQALQKLITTALANNRDLRQSALAVEAYMAQYQIQLAFREVADALIARETYADQVIAQKANLEASRDYYTMAGDRYNEGLDSYLTLLDAQRSLYIARQGLVAL